MACKYPNFCTVILKLIEVNLDFVQEKNNDGSIPLHVAMKYYYDNNDQHLDPKMNVFMKLISVWPLDINMHNQLLKGTQVAITTPKTMKEATSLVCRSIQRGMS
jgi:hypothetical protein